MSDQEDEYDSGSDGEETKNEEKFHQSYIVIAIDCHASMFVKNAADGTLPFRNCLEACYKIADSLLLLRTWAPFAIVLGKRDVHFIDFKNNIIDTMNLLKSKTMLDDEALRKEFMREYKLEYSNFFLNCKKIFHDINASFFRLTLLFITNDDNPVDNKNERYQTINEVRTFSGSQIVFEVIPTRNDFKYDLFYTELFSAMGSELIVDICLDVDGLYEKISSLVHITLRKQSMQFYPFKNDTERFINCVTFNPLHKTTFLNDTLTKEGKKVKSFLDITENVENEYELKFGGPEKVQNIVLNSFERDNLYDYGLKFGLHLIYVSKRITDIGVVLRTPRLLQENTRTPSQYFNKFWQSCAQNERVLVCIMKIKQYGELQYVELIPLLVDNKPTFLIQRIPYFTNVQDYGIEEYPEQENNPEHKELIEELVRKLTISFDLSMIPDPWYRRKVAYVKAKLLEKEVMEEETSINLCREALNKILADLVPNMNAFCVQPDKKRKDVGNSQGSSYQKKKK